jgi:hypothetical protein
MSKNAIRRNAGWLRWATLVSALGAEKILNYCDWTFPMVKMRQTTKQAAVFGQRLKWGGLAVMWLGTLAIVAPPAQAGWLQAKPSADDYRLCGIGLDKAGIAKDVAAMACAEVLHPEDLAVCVGNITTLKLEAVTTLNACRRVRRPLELATCVQDIHKQDANAVLGNVLEACRQSLLPDRYGKCVVGLNQSLKTPIAQGLATCIDASDRPIDVLSDFVPINNLCHLKGFGAIGSPASCDQGAAIVTPGTSGTSSVTPVPAKELPAQLY